MVQYFQANWGTITAMLVVALLVFLAIRRMVVDKRAGIGACGQKCSQCAKMGHCEEAVGIAPPVNEGSYCSGVCSSCKYSTECHKK